MLSLKILVVLTSRLDTMLPASISVINLQWDTAPRQLSPAWSTVGKTGPRTITAIHQSATLVWRADTSAGAPRTHQGTYRYTGIRVPAHRHPSRSAMLHVACHRRHFLPTRRCHLTKHAAEAGGCEHIRSDAQRRLCHRHDADQATQLQRLRPRLKTMAAQSAGTCQFLSARGTRLYHHKVHLWHIASPSRYQL